MLSSIILYSVIVLLSVALITTAVAGFKAAPFVPTYQRDVIRMLDLANVKKNDSIVDLGAGDGRFLVTAAQHYGARATGYELSMLMFAVASLRVSLSGARNRITLRCADFFKADLSHFDVVCCFLTPMAMKKLEPKFLNECRPGTRIVSYAFRLPTLEPNIVSKPTPTSSPAFLYVIPAPPS